MTNRATELDTKNRLRRAERILCLLDKRRLRHNDPHLGSNIERMVIERELRELENDILADPGALAAHIVLVPVHQKRQGKQ